MRKLAAAISAVLAHAVWAQGAWASICIPCTNICFGGGDGGGGGGNVPEIDGPGGLAMAALVVSVGMIFARKVWK
jgi:hypothetical protein